MSAVDNYVRRNVPRKADGRIDFTLKRHHGFHLFIMVLGWFVPPLAVAVRFGIGKDFFINVICTICGYFPGHAHNFFIQNIRNNERKSRTPKWAKRYGLVEDYDKKRAKKRAWVGRYNEQTSDRRLYDDEGNAYTYDRDHRFEDGDAPSRARQNQSKDVDGIEERYYGSEERSSGSIGNEHDIRRTRSTASMNGYGDAAPTPGAGEAERRRSKSKSRMRGLLGSRKGKADRHARSEQVMGVGSDTDYVRRNNYDPSMDDSLEGSSRRDSIGDGPEEADATVGKQYSRNRRANRDPLDSKVLPLAPSNDRPEPVDIMNDNHVF